jgi:GTPase-associated adaptor domain
MSPARELVYAFLTLSFYKRCEIAKKLGLVNDDDPDETDMERCTRWFQRARVNKKRAQLWEEVMNQSGRPPNPNPFVGMS